MKKLLLVLGVLFVVCSTRLYASEGILSDLPIEITSDIAVNSKYVWRGFLLDDDPVVQPGIYISNSGFTVSLWGSFDVDADDNLNSDEVDYSIDYTHEFKNFSISGGLTYYDFPGADTFSRECYIGLGTNLLFSPTLTWYHDYGKESSGGGNGNYVLLALDHNVEIGDKGVNIDFNTYVGYNDKLFIEGHGGDIGFGVSVNIPLNENIIVSPNVNYSVPFDDLKDSNDGNQDEEFWAGLTFIFSY